ncbi:MAG: NAD(+)/NADH kinase, partial [Proteobacteria bacterium]|nr:NAD(+)/NADH kinase [Pseudomonadota bacterium]
MKIAIVASRSNKSQEAYAQLRKLYGDNTVRVKDADVILALGGDGFMLSTLHQFIGDEKPVFGMRRGTVGFLMNRFNTDDLLERLVNSQVTVLHPLKMLATTTKGEHFEA